MCSRSRTTTIKHVKLLVRIVSALFALGVALILGAAGAGLFFWNTASIDTTGQVAFDRPLHVPPLADSTVADDGTRVFDLTLQRGTSDLGHGPETETWGVNGNYLGPTLRATRGENIRVNVTNEIGETSTLHWHGMHLPAAMDGGPHQRIEPGATWSPHWTIDQPAATLWYHPHLHGSTAAHVYRGLAGMFLLDEASGPELPHRYGIDDLPIIVQDKKFDGTRLDEDNTMFANVGTLGDEILVNGTPGAFLDVTTERIRLRLLNASNARIYNFSFDTGLPFRLIGTDGGLLEAPVTLRSLQLSPGERAEIVVEAPAGTRNVLRSTPPDLRADFWQTRFSGGDDSVDVLELRAADTLEPNELVPAPLATLDDLGEPTVTRTFDLTSATEINGLPMDMNRIDEVVVAGTTELWEVTNISGMVHNFHIHDVQFQVVEATGMPADHPTLTGRKDTVYVPPGATVRLLMRFGDHADPDVPYMYHCHLLRHEDDGMMGQFVVVGAEEVDQVGVLPLGSAHGSARHSAEDHSG
ncbi:MAG TPA: multicopper oxidase domain-containing protein [Rhodococcus sp. (in: high G+C Gram-positive bacteria)]|uniref:multicopper oxidase family protein n=1 Tax=Rhodococcus sp. SJ-3 TaxID=3454628 RepID=UPI002D85670F|nr:multicopper oxidase domain-containing protein [Rhodococcus sp. (in: high G+C Gram-positive bacteria)]